MLWIPLLAMQGHMRLPLTSSQIDKLKLGYDDVFFRTQINLRDGESQNTMTPTGRVVDSMRGHHFILKSFPEILECIAHVMALELVDVLDIDGAALAGLDLQAGHSVKQSQFILYLVVIRVQEIVHFFIVELDVLAAHGNLTLSLIHISEPTRPY